MLLEDLFIVESMSKAELGDVMLELSRLGTEMSVPRLQFDANLGTVLVEFGYGALSDCTADDIANIIKVFKACGGVSFRYGSGKFMPLSELTAKGGSLCIALVRDLHTEKPKPKKATGAPFGKRKFKIDGSVVSAEYVKYYYVSISGGAVLKSINTLNVGDSTTVMRNRRRMSIERVADDTLFGIKELFYEAHLAKIDQDREKEFENNPKIKAIFFIIKLAKKLDVSLMTSEQQLVLLKIFSGKSLDLYSLHTDPKTLLHGDHDYRTAQQKKIDEFVAMIKSSIADIKGLKMSIEIKDQHQGDKGVWLTFR